LFAVLYSDAFDQHCGVGILRLREGLDCSSAKLDVIAGRQIAYRSQALLLTPQTPQGRWCGSQNFGINMLSVKI